LLFNGNVGKFCVSGRSTHVGDLYLCSQISAECAMSGAASFSYFIRREEETV